LWDTKSGPQQVSRLPAVFIGNNVHHKNRKKKKIEQKYPTVLHEDHVATNLNSILTSYRLNPKLPPHCYGCRLPIHLLLGTDPLVQS
jgi:hypothetical protein